MLFSSRTRLRRIRSRLIARGRGYVIPKERGRIAPRRATSFDAEKLPLLADNSSAVAKQTEEKPVRRGGRLAPASAGWDYEEGQELSASPSPRQAMVSAEAEILSLFSEPGIFGLTVDAIAKSLSRPQQDIQNTLEAMWQSGEIARDSGPPMRYYVSESRKTQLERMYVEAAYELGETGTLMPRSPSGFDMVPDDLEPRLPITVGILSLFVPGTGQLLNGEIGRAALVFVVWGLALLSPFNSIVHFVCLYAGVQAFFNAKIRRLERQQALQEDQTCELPPQLSPSR